MGRMAGACMHRWTHTQQQGPDGPDGHTQQQGPDGPDGHTHTTTRAGRARWTHTQQGPDGPDGHTHNNKGRTDQMDTHNNKGRMDQMDPHTTTRAGQARWTHTQNPDGYVKRQETSWYNKKILAISDPAGTGRLGRMAGACMQKHPVDHTHRSASPLGLPAGLHACNALAPSAHCLAPVFGGDALRCV